MTSKEFDARLAELAKKIEGELVNEIVSDAPTIDVEPMDKEEEDE